MKRASKTVSVVELGSSMVRMGVYQAGKSGLVCIDRLEYPLRLGHEVFTQGRISVATVREMSGILRGFSQVMKEYGVSEYRAFATTALREADNRAYVLDQLRIQNNLAVEVLEDGEESALVYAELLRSPLLEDGSLLSYIGTGSLGVAVCEGRTVVQMGNITIGFLKLGEMLRSVMDQTTHFHRVLEEYVETNFRRLTLRLGDRTFRHLVLAGRELETFASLCGVQPENGAYILTRDRLEGLYGQIKDLHTSAIARQFSLAEETAGHLLPMLAIYLRMLEFTQADRIVAPCVHMMDSMAGQMLLPAEKQYFETVYREGALASARGLASRRSSDTVHADRVCSYAVLLFNKLKKLHGISGRRLLLLECAALLHEAGYNLNEKDPSLATYDLVKQAYLFGLKEEETCLIAEVARYGDVRQALSARADLPGKQRLMVDKLAAIMILADALDESHHGKIEELKIRLEEERLVISAKGREDMLLEKWAVGECAPFFADVFGVEPVFLMRTARA